MKNMMKKKMMSKNINEIKNKYNKEMTSKNNIQIMNKDKWRLRNSILAR